MIFVFTSSPIGPSSEMCLARGTPREGRGEESRGGRPRGGHRWNELILRAVNHQNRRRVLFEVVCRQWPEPGCGQ